MDDASFPRRRGARLFSLLPLDLDASSLATSQSQSRWLSFVEERPCFAFWKRPQRRRGAGAVAALLAYVFASAPAHGALFRVPEDFPTISAAANAALASGDSIQISPFQTYQNETVQLRSGVTLFGLWHPQDFHWPFIEGSTIYTLNGPDSTRIERLYIIGGQYEEQLVLFNPRTAIDQCIIAAAGPFTWVGIRVWYGARISNCRLRAAGDEATSLAYRQGTLQISNCLFDSALYAIIIQNEGAPQPADVHMINNTFLYQIVDLLVNPWSTVDVVNNIFWELGISTCHGSPASSGIRYNDFWNAASCAGYGEGNIFEEPMFCEYPNPVWWLNAESPCVGTGEGGANIGAYGVGCGVAGTPDSEVLPRPYLQHRSYPDPFEDGVTIAIDMAGRPPVQVSIYDVTGRLVGSPAAGASRVGVAEFFWDAREQPSGTYFYRVSGGGEIVVGRFTKMR